MICPKCGAVDPARPVPEATRRGAVMRLGTCAKCRTAVYAVPTRRAGEACQAATVDEGEAREQILADLYVRHLGPGFTHQSRPAAADIDRTVRGPDGRLHHYLEIKERSCSLNAYRQTKFPFAKILAARRLNRRRWWRWGKRIPVRFLLKFIDSWAYFDFDPKEEYVRGQEAFAPRYRPGQKNRGRQVPVVKPVETLHVLPIDAECDRTAASRAGPAFFSD